MYFSTSKRHCRWCGTLYQPLKATDRDGPCSKKCKAAHYRAYKKYVTEVERQGKRTGKIGNAGTRSATKKVLTKS